MLEFLSLQLLISSRNFLYQGDNYAHCHEQILRDKFKLIYV